MTLKEAIERAEYFYSCGFSNDPDEVEALRLVIEAAKQQADDTVEIVTLTESRK